MRRVHALRRDQRENIAQVIVAHLLALRLGQTLIAAQADALRLEQFVQFRGQQPLLLDNLAHHHQACA